MAMRSARWRRRPRRHRFPLQAGTGPLRPLPPQDTVAPRKHLGQRPGGKQPRWQTPSTRHVPGAGREPGGRVSFLLFTVRPRSARARRGGTALGRRYGHGGGTHLSSSLGSLLRRGGSSWRQQLLLDEAGLGAATHTHPAAAQPYRHQPLFPCPSPSSLPPGINKVFKMAGSRAARRKREGGGQSAPAARPARGGQGRVRVTRARPRWRKAARGGGRAIPLRGGAVSGGMLRFAF